jgi:hypothetical protein
MNLDSITAAERIDTHLTKPPLLLRLLPPNSLSCAKQDVGGGAAASKKLRGQGGRDWLGDYQEAPALVFDKKMRGVSLQASFDGGEVLTKPLRLLGSPRVFCRRQKRGHLNAKSDFGEILVEVFDLAGNSIARSKPIRGDSLDITIDWEYDGLKRLEDPVVLRFTLRNTCLFAVWCT